MTDRYGIGQSNLKDTQFLGNNKWWTLTTDQKEKIKSPRFAFLKISASAFGTFAIPHKPLHDPSFAKEPILPTLYQIQRIE